MQLLSTTMKGRRKEGENSLEILTLAFASWPREQQFSKATDANGLIRDGIFTRILASYSTSMSSERCFYRLTLDLARSQASFPSC